MTACSNSPTDEATADSDGETETTDDDSVTIEQDEATDDPITEGEEEVFEGDLADFFDAPEPDETPIEVDPDVLVGTLDNGLTYYLRTNDTPADGLSVRLVVNAGSLQQEVADSGSAHFLEHMLFNGTEKFPGNELTRELEALGAQFGADTNAYTSFAETVYELDIPDADAEKQAVAFDVMAQWASAATITEEDTIEERGVVREEARLSLEGVGAEFGIAGLDAAFANTDYENRLPIGTEENILATTADQLREYYDRWYRPDNMAVVAVGDVSVDELEALVVANFSDLTSRGDDQERTDASAEREPFLAADVVIDDSLPLNTATAAYPITNWGTSTVGRERITIMQQVYGWVINNALQDAESTGGPVRNGFAFGGPITRAQSQLVMSYEGDDLAQTTEFVLGEVMRRATIGFTDSEVEQAVAEVQALIDQELNAAEAIDSALLSNAYSQHFLQGTAISSTEDELARWTATLESLTPEELHSQFQWDVFTSAPIVTVGGPDADDLPSEDELFAALIGAMEGGGELEAGDDVDSGEEGGISELMAAPAGVEPISTEPLGAFDGTTWTYENGVTVNFAPATTPNGSVLVLANGPGGWANLGEDDALLSAAAIEAAATSGAGGHSQVDYRRFVNRTSASFVAGSMDSSRQIFGDSGNDDLEILFQQIHLFMTAPQVDDSALNTTIENSMASRGFFELDAGSAISNALEIAAAGGDERFGFAPSEAVDTLTADKALEIVTAQFGNANGMTFDIAGDIDVAVVQELANQYLATLPSGDEPAVIDVRPPLITENVRVDLDLAIDENAAAGASVAYQVDRSLTVQTFLEHAVLTNILNDRLLTTAREELGATYGGFAYFFPVIEPIERGGVAMQITGDPERVDELLGVMIAAGETLADESPSDDEFQRAVAVLEADLGGDLSNEILVSMLTPPASEPGIVGQEAQLELLAAMTPADITTLAAETFSAPRIEIVAQAG